MARFRKMKRYASRLRTRFQRKSRRSSGSDNILMTAVAAAAYGAVRPKIDSILTPYTGGMLGGYMDEVALGTGGYFLAKKGGKNLKSVGKAIMIIEAARIGSGLMGGVSGNSQIFVI